MLPKNINDCVLDYMIIRKADSKRGIKQTEVRPGIMCKGLGQGAAESIIKNAPYKDLKDLAMKTDTRLVDLRSITALFDAGFFRNTKTNEVLKGEKIKEILCQKFSTYRNDRKKAGRKGVASGDLFPEK